jgi:hypothetical protein
MCPAKHPPSLHGLAHAAAHFRVASMVPQAVDPHSRWRKVSDLRRSVPEGLNGFRLGLLPRRTLLRGPDLVAHARKRRAQSPSPKPSRN